MTPRPVAGAIAALLVAAALAILFRPPPAKPRLVLLYATCTVNKQFLSTYNSKVGYTPNLARFAAAGTVFEEHHTEEGQSGIAYASLFTGNHAMRHGIYYHPLRLDDSAYTMAEAYRDAGYDTFFWADHPMASPELNYAQGVPAEHLYWHQRAKIAPKIERFLKAEDPRFQTLLARLKRNPNYRALVITNFTVTHAPYGSDQLDEFCQKWPQECAGWPGPELTKYGRLLYRNMLGWQYAFDFTADNLKVDKADQERMKRFAELAYKSKIHHLDFLFGSILNQLERYGLAGDSLVAFTSDHGEMMFRDNLPIHWNHGFALAPEDIMVPFILRGGAVPSGRYSGVTRSIDVFPTLAGLSGVALPEGTTMGVDLSAAILGRREPPQLEAFSHTSLLPDSLLHGWFEVISKPFPRRDPNVMWVAVRSGDLAYKLTSPDGANFRARVFDWKRDPGERRDLYDQTDTGQAAVIKRLAEYKSHLVDAYSYWQALGEGRLPSEREKELLRSLGYLN